jgi:hypothetical protein
LKFQSTFDTLDFVQQSLIDIGAGNKEIGRIVSGAGETTALKQRSQRFIVRRVEIDE